VSRTLTVRWRAAAPAPGSIAGDYAGRTTQNESIRFAVDERRNLTRLEIGRLNEGCIYPDGNRVARVGGGIGPIGRSFPIADDGTFEIVLTAPTPIGSVTDAVSRVTIEGRMRSGTAVGTIREDIRSPSEEKLSCTTGDQSWVAARD